MSRRRRSKVSADPIDAPPLRGIARLLVETPAEELDLHGSTAREASSRVRAFLASRTKAHGGRVVHIITGRGNHSEEGPVLRPLVRELLAEDLNDQVAEWAGLQGGGGFAVRLRAGR